MEIIDISPKLEEFKRHIEENPRVVLSAKFGDGKTFMLNQLQKYYDIKNGGDTYFITIHPVNYSVGKNEDIFEYIKRDILLKLYNEKQLDNLDLGAFFKTILSWDNLKEIIGFVMSFIPGGKFYTKFINESKKFYDKYKEARNTFPDYDATFKQQKGGIYEDDAFTSMIVSALKDIAKKDKEGKVTKTCLIIEDLDRIDPGHLFRILNIIASHVDSDKQSNKFGFDSIVLVMDYDVTGHIFHHFYGEQANYEGYMAKFFSKYPFRYSIQDIARNMLKEKLLYEYKIPERIMKADYRCFEGKSGVDHHSLWTDIEKLSLRDIDRILSGIDYQFKADYIQFNKTASKVFTHSPMSYYMAALQLMNVKYNTYVINYNLCNLGEIYIKALGPFMFVNSPGELMRGLKLPDGRPIIITDQKDTNGVIVDIIMQNRIYSSSDTDYKEPCKQAFNKTCENIKDIQIQS